MLEKMQRKTWYLTINSVFGAWLLLLLVAIIFQRFLTFPLWVIVHVTLLGAVSTAIYIWSQHFADTLTRRKAPGGRNFFAIRFLLHSVGSFGVLIGVTAQLKPVLIVGVAMVFIAALIHTWVMLSQLKGALTSRFGGLVKFYAVAGVWLAVGTGIGFFVTQTEFGSPLRQKLYLAHTGINLFGWIGTTVIGTIIIFLPTVLHTRMRERDGQKSALVLTLISIATLVIAVGGLIDSSLTAALGLLVWLVALGILLNEAVRQIIASKTRDYAALSLIAAIFWLALTVTYLTVSFIVSANISEAIVGLKRVLPAFILGFVLQIVAGSFSYLVAVVMGGPANRKTAEKELGRFRMARVIIVNLGTLMTLFAFPGTILNTLYIVVLLALLTFIPLTVRAVRLASKN